jgi:hypothetical protein
MSLPADHLDVLTYQFLFEILCFFDEVIAIIDDQDFSDLELDFDHVLVFEEFDSDYDYDFDSDTWSE